MKYKAGDIVWVEIKTFFPLRQNISSEPYIGPVKVITPSQNIQGNNWVFCRFPIKISGGTSYYVRLKDIKYKVELW